MKAVEITKRPTDRTTRFTAAALPDSPAAAAAMVAASLAVSQRQATEPEVAVGVSIQPLELPIAATARRPKSREE